MCNIELPNKIILSLRTHQHLGLKRMQTAKVIKLENFYRQKFNIFHAKIKLEEFERLCQSFVLIVFSIMLYIYAAMSWGAKFCFGCKVF